MTLYLYYTLYYTQTLSRYINLSFIAAVAPSPWIGNATLHRDSRGRAHEREVKWHIAIRTLQPFTGIRVVERTNAR